MSAAAFKATFAGFKSLTSGGIRASFDIDGPEIETALEVLTHGGMPSAAKGTWFAIARLNIGGAATQNPTHTIGNTSERGAARNSLSQRAALLCNDPQFRLFLERTYLPSNNHCNSEADAAEIVRHLCDVESRADIRLGTPAADKFDRLVANFTIWKHADKYVETPRIQQENEA